MAGLIRFHDVDLLGVQEALRRQLDDLVTDLPEYEWSGVCRTDGSVNPNPDGEFSAILYRKDRFEKLDGSTFWLSETPDKPGSIGWDAALPRIVTWVKFRDKLTGTIFIQFSTHFDHMGVRARNESALLLLQKIKSIAGELPVILTGDFNCGDSEQPYLTLTNNATTYYLSDTKTNSQSPHYGPTATFAGSFRVADLIDHPIDFVFIRNHIDVLKHATLSDSWNGDMASDHLPVWTAMKIK